MQLHDMSNDNVTQPQNKDRLCTYSAYVYLIVMDIFEILRGQKNVSHCILMSIRAR